MNQYKSKFNINNLYLRNFNQTAHHKIIYRKSQIINIYMLSDVLKIYNGKFLFKKYISLWCFGYKFGQLVWTKKRAKYKSKLKLKVKLKLLSQKKQKIKQKKTTINQKKLYNRFKHIIIPKSNLTKIKSNNKLR